MQAQVENVTLLTTDDKVACYPGPIHLLATPCARLRPAQPRGFVITVEGHELIVFDMRVLVDLGFARDQGEGIPRMFTEMKDAFLPQPSIEATNRSVTVALRNTLTLNAGELGADTEELGADTEELGADTEELGADTEELGADTEELGADTEEELPPAIRIAIDQLGPRPRRERLRPLIHAICDQDKWVTSAELAELLNFRQHNLTAGHLAPMVKSGQLERRFPGQPNHPRQAYRAVAQSPAT